MFDIRSYIQRSRLLKDTKKEYITEKVVITSDVRDRMRALKVERDLEFILTNYYDCGEYKEFEVRFKPEVQQELFRLLSFYAIEYLQISEERVLIKCPI